MAGTTITHNGKTVKSVLKKIGKSIIKAFPTMQPDSDVVLYNPVTEEGKIFKAIIKWRKWRDKQDEQDYPESVDFQEVKSGNIAMPATVASIFARKPRKGEWQGSLHLHT